jgi:diguanylate cyclase (GGDEF)-like protein
MSIIRGLRLSTRFVGVSLGLLLLVQAASFTVIHAGIERNARANLARELEQGGRVWHRLLEQRAQKLRQGATLLSADFGFRSAVIGGDADTLGSVLDNHGARIGATYVAFLDTKHSLLAHGTGDYQSVTAALKAMSGTLDARGEATAVLEGRAYQFVMVPLKAPVLMGWVVMGFPIDQAVLQEIQAITGQQVVLASGGASTMRIILSTLPAAALGGRSWRQEAGDVIVAGHAYVVHQATPFPDKPAQPHVQAWLLGSVAEAVAPYQAVQYSLALITVAGLLLFALGSWLTARRVVQPLLDLVRASERLAQGHYDEQPAHVHRQDEIGELSKAFDHMRISIASQQHEIRRLAYWDRLTGLPNRAQFRDTVAEKLVQAQQQKQALTVLMLDLDRFKHVNDVLGYAVGDRLLQVVALRLQGVLGPHDLVARLGGDEFALLLPHSNIEQALDMARTVAAAFEHPLVLEDQTIDVGAGIGVAGWPDHADDADVLLSRAEVAMYAAKRQTSGAKVYDPQQDASSTQTLSLLTQLRQALDNQELRLYLQPKIDLKTRQMIGAEALVRWQHPQRGLVPPMAFIPFAEQTGFIRQLTLWMFEQCVRHQAQLMAQGVARVSVNLSTRDLLDQDLPDKLAVLLKAHGAVATGFCLEITESAIMDDPQRAEQTLNLLAQRGFKLSIDDFGTGYSSLAYLKRLPVNELKIDRSFVMAMASASGDAKIVRSTIDLAHNLGLTVVAEGVETEAVAQALADLSCDEAQGYLYAKPLPVPDFLNWAQRWQPLPLVLVEPQDTCSDVHA